MRENHFLVSLQLASISPLSLSLFKKNGVQHPGGLFARPVAPGVLVLVSSRDEARGCRAGVALGSLLLLFSFSALDRLRICVVVVGSLFGSVSDGSCLSLVPPRPIVVRASQEEQCRKVRSGFGSGKVSQFGGRKKTA